MQVHFLLDVTSIAICAQYVHTQIEVKAIKCVETCKPNSTVISTTFTACTVQILGCLNRHEVTTVLLLIVVYETDKKSSMHYSYVTLTVTVSYWRLQCESARQ